ncbi:hypothetical protein E5083_31030 [Streptomyces bauhiniae]|uniref:Uncharacterized protein n=1 Tax=Streptomyces bauhiniae TaxID=2340725 RepID=A0A4Z1CTJ8_9ACTN|nr:hypothetical protein [Streptomyces bauhiniae]TGN72134.1 hypothetical protein E5083_31030 [Streptomyces bauhiniae]
MGYEYAAEGTVTVTPPIPLSAIRELTEGPDLPIFTVVPGLDDPGAAGPWADIVGLWALIPADAPLDAEEPVTVGALKMDHTSKSAAIGVPLARFVRLCREAGHEVTSDVKFWGEEGERGVIEVDGSDVAWVETYHPTRKLARW